jgi:hypothetical protein
MDLAYGSGSRVRDWGRMTSPSHGGTVLDYYPFGDGLVVALALSKGAGPG